MLVKLNLTKIVKRSKISIINWNLMASLITNSEQNLAVNALNIRFEICLILSRHFLSRSIFLHLLSFIQTLKLIKSITFVCFCKTISKVYLWIITCTKLKSNWILKFLSFDFGKQNSVLSVVIYVPWMRSCWKWSF